MKHTRFYFFPCLSSEFYVSMKSNTKRWKPKLSKWNNYRICIWWLQKTQPVNCVFVRQFVEGNGTPLQYSCLEKSHGQRSLVGYSPWGHWESDTTERLHFHFSLSSLEKEMATHSSVLAWRIPGTEEPGGLPSLGSHRVGHDWSDLAAAAATVLFFILLTKKIWFNNRYYKITWFNTEASDPLDYCFRMGHVWNTRRFR